MSAKAGKCETPGCGNSVSKPGYNLCLSCWKKSRADSRPQSGDFGKKKSPAENGSDGGMLTATKLGEKVGLKAQRVNAILSELGWIESDRGGGWKITEAGKLAGARQKKHQQSGRPFAVWPPAIVDNKFFRDAVGELREDAGKSADLADSAEHAHGNLVDDIRKKYPPVIRATDGHYVRSRAEAMIDNYLYRDARVVHAYERKVPVEEDMLCDFFIPSGEGHGSVYIEFWGLDGSPEYRKRKERKQAVYKKHGLNLIDLGDKEVANLDDHLPRLLREFGIKVE